MLHKQHRLTTTISSGALFAKTPFFILKFRENGNEYSRFGFVVSKRVAKSAVVRNRTRRLARAIIEQSLGEIRKGYDMLFILTKPLEGSDEIRKTILETLKAKKLWQNT
jgi:ribonuclease P protein component